MSVELFYVKLPVPNLKYYLKNGLTIVVYLDGAVIQRRHSNEPVFSQCSRSYQAQLRSSHMREREREKERNTESTWLARIRHVTSVRERKREKEQERRPQRAKQRPDFQERPRHDRVRITTASGSVPVQWRHHSPPSTMLNGIP